MVSFLPNYMLLALTYLQYIDMVITFMLYTPEVILKINFDESCTNS